MLRDIPDPRVSLINCRSGCLPSDSLPQLVLMVQRCIRDTQDFGLMTTNMGWDAGEAPPSGDSLPEVPGDTWAFHNFALPEFRGIAKHLSRPQRHDLIKAWTNKVWLKDPRHLEHPRR